MGSIQLAIVWNQPRYNWKNFLSRRRKPPFVASISGPSPLAGAEARCISIADRLATTVSLSDSANSGYSRRKIPTVSCAISSTSQSSVAKTVALRGSPVSKEISPKHSPAARLPTAWNLIFRGDQCVRLSFFPLKSGVESNPAWSKVIGAHVPAGFGGPMNAIHPNIFPFDR